MMLVLLSLSFLLIILLDRKGEKKGEGGEGVL